jgi:hypothetical protein
MKKAKPIFDEEDFIKWLRITPPIERLEHAQKLLACFAPDGRASVEAIFSSVWRTYLWQLTALLFGEDSAQARKISVRYVHFGEVGTEEFHRARAKALAVLINKQTGVKRNGAKRVRVQQPIRAKELAK